MGEVIDLPANPTDASPGNGESTIEIPENPVNIDLNIAPPVKTEDVYPPTQEKE